MIAASCISMTNIAKQDNVIQLHIYTKSLVRSTSAINFKTGTKTQKHVIVPAQYYVLFQKKKQLRGSIEVVCIVYGYTHSTSLCLLSKESISLSSMSQFSSRYVQMVRTVSAYSQIQKRQYQVLCWFYAECLLRIYITVIECILTAIYDASIDLYIRYIPKILPPLDSMLIKQRIIAKVLGCNASTSDERVIISYYGWTGCGLFVFTTLGAFHYEC